MEGRLARRLNRGYSCAGVTYRYRGRSPSPLCVHAHPCASPIGSITQAAQDFAGASQFGGVCLDLVGASSHPSSSFARLVYLKTVCRVLFCDLPVVNAASAFSLPEIAHHHQPLQTKLSTTAALAGLVALFRNNATNSHLFFFVSSIPAAVANQQQRYHPT